jgi:hypothetical protein
MISSSIRKRAFSARTRDNSISSGVIALAPGALSFPAFAAGYCQMLCTAL